jgi:hypothetical protein
MKALLTGISATTLAATALVMAPTAGAAPALPCAPGPVAGDGSCTLAPGASVILLLKGGNGGAGGSGGAGGAGGAGWDGAASVPAGLGGVGGVGGAGGAGAKWQGVYTNSTADTVLLEFTIGANGADGPDGAAGSPGVDSTQSGAASSGGTGQSGAGGAGGAGGEDTYVQVDSVTIAIAPGGDGGSGGQGGAGGEGGQSTGTAGRDGTAGSDGAAGAAAAGGNLPTTNAEAPSITILEQPMAGAPVWMQSYAPSRADECRDGWSSSWALWTNEGRGGAVCNRYIVLKSGMWMQGPDPDLGPFSPWDLA